MSALLRWLWRAARHEPWIPDGKLIAVRVGSVRPYYKGEWYGSQTYWSRSIQLFVCYRCLEFTGTTAKLVRFAQSLPNSFGAVVTLDTDQVIPYSCFAAPYKPFDCISPAFTRLYANTDEILQPFNIEPLNAPYHLHLEKSMVNDNAFFKSADGIAGFGALVDDPEAWRNALDNKSVGTRCLLKAIREIIVAFAVDLELANGYYMLDCRLQRYCGLSCCS